jgi:hypothetical protein
MKAFLHLAFLVIFLAFCNTIIAQKGESKYKKVTLGDSGNKVNQYYPPSDANHDKTLKSEDSALLRTNARITDVDFHLEGSFIVVNYVLGGTIPKEELTIELSFVTEGNEKIIPHTVSSDAGTNVFMNGNRVVIWDIEIDKPSVTGIMKAVVSITSAKILYGSPKNALLSVAVPGLGGFFVEKNKTRAALTTVSTIGLIVYGINQKNYSRKYYREYNSGIIPADIHNLYNKANSAQHKYFVATRVAAAIWVTDIIWVTIKGIKNREESEKAYKTTSDNGLKLNYGNSVLQLGYSVTF